MIYKIIAKFLNWLRVKKPVITPQVDEKWQLIDNNRGPWQTDDVPVITIRDVKDGWVRYRIGKNFKFLFQDERLPIETFVNIYKKIQ